MDTQPIKDTARRHFASVDALVGFLKNIGFLALIVWFIGKPYVDDYIDNRIEEAKIPMEEKFSWKVANEIDGAEQKDVHKFIGGMFNNFSMVSDSMDAFKKHLLPKLIRLTLLTIVGPVVENSHEQYIDWNNESYRVRGTGDQKYWIDDQGHIRDMSGRRFQH